MLGKLPKAILEDPSVHMKARKFGMLLGKMGREALEGKLKLKGVIFKLLGVLVKSVIAKIPKAGELAAKDYEQAAKQIIDGFLQQGIHVTSEEAVQIVEEIRKNPEAILGAIQRVEKAYTALQ